MNKKYHLNVDKSNHSIDGIKMSKSQFQRIWFVIVNEWQQGWRPSKTEILDLIHSDIHPSKIIKHDMSKLDKQMKRDAKYF